MTTGTKPNGHAADLPPDNPEAERGLLRSLFAVPEAIARREIAVLQPRDFCDPAHRLIFRHLLGAHLEGGSPESLPARMSAAGDLSDDSKAALFDLLKVSVSGADAIYFADEVREAGEQRKLWQFQRDLASQISDRLPSADVKGFIGAFLEVYRDNHAGAKKMSDQLPDHKGMRKPVLHGLLREGETLNIIAPAKTGKSWLTYHLALCVVTGRRWLDTYLPVPGRVLIVDNELHEETLCDRIPRVAAAMGLRDHDWVDQLETITLRGRLKDIHALAGDELGNVAPGYYKLIAIDALYRVLPPDCEENSNSSMAAVYNTIDHLAARLQCAVVLVHHSTKGSQAGKSVTDVGAGAGSISRAADTHFVLRAHEEAGVVVADGVTRSWPPVEPFCLRWDWPLWRRDEHLDPALLKTDKPKKKPRVDLATVEEQQPWTAERFAAECATPEPLSSAALIDAGVVAGLTATTAEKLLKRAVATGKLHPWRAENDRRIRLFANVKMGNSQEGCTP